MLKNLMVMALMSVVLWDCSNAKAGESALQRAAAALIHWSLNHVEQVDWNALVDKTRASLEGGAENAQLASLMPTGGALPETTVVPRPRPVIEEGDALQASLPAPAGIDSVFSRTAVEGYIVEASVRTGVASGYLQHLAEKESAFNPVAEAEASTAAGLYQFIEQTWLDVYARYGALHDQEELAQKIVMNESGHYDVADRRALRAILDLRFDPKLSTFLAARHTVDNFAFLEAGLGREVNYIDLYIAHFLGPRGALKLLTTLERAPETSAVDMFPAAARANPSFFYKNKKREATAHELYEALLLLAPKVEEVPVAANMGLAS